jgi:peptide methionine sulfoxide reductase msrA/msrB
MKEIYLAGGCFWGVEKYLSAIPGVNETSVGYANGDTDAPGYREVCAGSGHAETVRVIYNPDELPLRKLLELFFIAIDPISVNRQGHDVGIQYRSGIYWTDEADRPAVLRSISELEAQLGEPTAVEAKPLSQFYPAEEYHQKYLEKNPGGYCHVGAAEFAALRAALSSAAE